MLYRRISDEYKSISNFAAVSGIPLEEINAVLLKENVALNISSGVKICKMLNLDAVNLALKGEIYEVAPDENVKSESMLKEFRDRYMRLSTVEKMKVFDYMNSF
jgi:hypothetical protein